MNMNREILRIALPNIVSNITVPLMGIVSIAIAGHWGADSAATIGALAIGVSIFNFIYWNCSFVRMGTSGLTAQAFGAGDFRERHFFPAREAARVAVRQVEICKRAEAQKRSRVHKLPSSRHSMPAGRVRSRALSRGWKGRPPPSRRCDAALHPTARGRGSSRRGRPVRGRRAHRPRPRRPRGGRRGR